MEKMKDGFGETHNQRASSQWLVHLITVKSENKGWITAQHSTYRRKSLAPRMSDMQTAHLQMTNQTRDRQGVESQRGEQWNDGSLYCEWHIEYWVLNQRYAEVSITVVRHHEGNSINPLHQYMHTLTLKEWQAKYVSKWDKASNMIGALRGEIYLGTPWLMINSSKL